MPAVLRDVVTLAHGEEKFLAGYPALAASAKLVASLAPPSTSQKTVQPSDAARDVS